MVDRDFHLRGRLVVLGLIGSSHAYASPTATLRLDCTDPSALDIALTVPSDGTPVFRMDDVAMGSPGMAKLVTDATASDDRGALPLVRRFVDGSLELAASRAAVGSVTLRYRAHAVAATDRGAREGLRYDTTGVGGAGDAFLVLPESRRVFRLRVEWAGTCGQGTSSFGIGDVDTTGELMTLRTAVYFVGHPRTFASDDGSTHLRSAWFGATAFDPADAAAWAARAFAAERRFFGDDDPTPYRVFVRVLASMGERANGVGQSSAFLSAIGPRTPFGPRLRTNIAHEMFHRWLGLRLRLAGPEGSSFWFTEGFTVFYANRLMLRAGLVSPDEFLAELNSTTTRLLANEHAAATNDEIRRRFYDDDALSVVPYARGALYAAELDAAIRKATHGARSLDDVMRELYRASFAAPVSSYGLHELPQGAVRDAVVRELGPSGAARFDAVIVRGAMPEPSSDAFGPCFERVARSYALYQLGFDPKQATVRKPGPVAAKAGLLDGDEIVSVESANVMADQEAVVTVKRAGKQLVFRYLPAGAKRDGYAWRRIAGVPDARCPP